MTHLNNKDKLNNFPRVYYITLEESIDRQTIIENQFSKYGIKPYGIISKRFLESNDIVVGQYLHQLNDGTKGCCVSHLKAIKEWYDNTDDDYAFFCEDDLSLETINYWDFTWEEFIESIPEDAECVQLLTIREDYNTFQLRERLWNDWSATAYIITRDYAKKIIDTYIKEDYYLLEIPNQEVMPLIENILFRSLGKVYTIPLFVENIKFKSTFEGSDEDVKNGHKNNHIISRNVVLNYWKFKSTQKGQSEIEKLLTEYSLDTENPEHNFNLGLWYENEAHTASALSYYLRCAERTEDTDLAYEALIRGSYCYKLQKERDGSTRSLLWQAQVLRPDRPEAYYLLSLYAEERKWWQDCYVNADLALRYCNFDQKPLRTDVGYPGKYGLLFEKAVSAWWWGKSDECKNLLLKIVKEYELPSNYLNLIHDNMKKIGIKYPTPVSLNERKNFFFREDFDWGELTYEDIITIDREIVNEKVYRFWKDVEENDIVVDIGASVGPFVCSILDNKPKKVYCIEPSKTLLETLKNNCLPYTEKYDENPLIYLNYGIVENDEDTINIFGNKTEFDGITFKKLIEDYSIDKIDFLKIDCEGGEYNIFIDDNIDFLLTKVKFIAMEVHLNYHNCRNKFKKFRDKYLNRFKNYQVMSCTRQNMDWGKTIDIKERIFDNNFIDEYSCEFMIYIYNQELK